MTSPSSSPPFERPIRLERRSGRLREWRHCCLLVPLLAGGWGWFGWTGLVPLVVWWWYVRPRQVADCWAVDLGDLRGARFGAWRVLLTFRNSDPLEIFSDELTPADRATLRREVKARLGGRVSPPSA
jgi:hypothetical protein